MLSRDVRRPLLAFVAACFIGTAPAHAYVDCTGTVTNLSIQVNTQDIVTLGPSSGPNFTYFCAINQEVNGVAPIICRTMYSTLMAAKLAGKRVLIRFYDHNSCASVPNWDFAGELGWTKLLLD